MDPWHDWLRRVRLVTESTIISYESDLVRLERYVGLPRHQIQLAHVASFLSNGFSPRTKERTFFSWRMYHRWGAARGLWQLNPEVIETRMRKKRVRVRPALTAAQARVLLHGAMGPVEIRTFYLGLYTGLRLAGICAVDKHSWKGGLISLYVKANWPLVIPVHQALTARRAEILSVNPSRKQIQGVCHRWRAHLDVPLSPQWLRRTYDQRLRFLRIEASVRHALMGHAPSSIEDLHYAPPTWEEMVDANARLYY